MSKLLVTFPVPICFHIVERFMASENEEFAVFFNKTYPSLCRFLECMLGGRERGQDIAQESFMQLYRKGLASLPGDEARFWIYRVARNLALNELKGAQTRNRLLSKVVEAFGSRRPNPEEDFELTERREIVFDLLKNLPERRRTALLLREQDEMSYRDIARVLDVSESKVKVDIFRARAALRGEWHAMQKGAANSAR